MTAGIPRVTSHVLRAWRVAVSRRRIKGEIMTLRLGARRVFATTGFIGLLLAAPATAAATPGGGPAGAPEPSCPDSVTNGVYAADCGAPEVNPPDSVLDPRGHNQVPTVRGVPCPTRVSCIGLSRVPEATAPVPDTSVRNSPVTGSQ